MAKLSPDSPIRFTGKLSNVVASEWNGMTVLKAAPHWHKKYKATPRQKANQGRFLYASRIIHRIFRELIDLTVEKEMGQTRHSIIMRELLNNALIGPWPDTYVDYSKLLLAKGTLPPADSPVVKAGEEGKIDFEWEYDPMNYPSSKKYGLNRTMLIAYSQSSQKVCYNVHGNKRQSGKASLQTQYTKGEEVHTWISFRTGDFGRKADSVYTGKVKIK